MDILIVGCGIAGSTLASFLMLSPASITKQIRITILERASSLRPHGQNIDVRGQGVAILRKLGLDAAVKAATTGEEGVQIVDGQGRIWASFAADKTGKVQTPTSDIEILRGRLAELCWKRSESLSDADKAAGGSGIECIFGDYISSLTQDSNKVQVTFAKSGKTRSFDLVVGADGMQSHTRMLAWGSEHEKTAVKRLGAFGGFFSMPRASSDTSWRKWFHTTRRRAIMTRPDGTGDRTTVFMTVMSDSDERFLQVGSRDNGSTTKQKELLREYFEGAGWETPRIVDEMMRSDDFYYDALGQVHMDTWSNGRVVLLGDAGYCASPMSGMGTTLALTGAYTLAGALISHPGNYKAAFAEYEAGMRPTVAKAQNLAPGIPGFVHPDSAWAVAFFHAFVYLFQVTGVFLFIFKHFGPPADKVSIEEYGFRQATEM